MSLVDMQPDQLRIIGPKAYSQTTSDVVDFEDRGWTQDQFTDFSTNYKVVYHQPNTENGFSATLFQNVVTGKYTIAFRGTESDMDFIQDLALTLGTSTLDPRSQENYIGNFLSDAGILDASGEVNAEFAGNVDFAGHSLGGYLSVWAAYKYQDVFDQVYTFNGAGISRVGPIAPITALIVDNALDDSQQLRMHNLYGDEFYELVANHHTLYRPGESRPLFIESKPEEAVLNHSMSLLVDSLAVYRLYSLLDDSLAIDDITDILSASNHETTQSLESAISALSGLLGDGFNFSDESQTQEFYTQLETAIETAAADPENQLSDIRLQSLTGALDDVLELAGDGHDDLQGNAYRYALDQLLPFLVTAGIESTTAASSDYNYDAEKYSEAYLQDRALMLQAVLQRNTADTAFPEDINGERLYFSDEITGQTAFAGQSNKVHYGSAVIDKDDFTNILFGDDTDNSLAGGGSDDRLYGRGGADYLSGQDGNDILKGGAGDDTLDGGRGTDTLHGGSGSDTYIIHKSPVWQGDTTIIGDLGGDRIEYDGAQLTGAKLNPLAAGSNIYRDSTDGTLYVYNAGLSQLWINFNQTATDVQGVETTVNIGNIFIEGFDPLNNNPGIALPAAELLDPQSEIDVALGLPNSGERLHSTFAAREAEAAQAIVNDLKLYYQASRYYPEPALIAGGVSPQAHTYRFEGGNNSDWLIGQHWDTSAFLVENSVLHGDGNEVFGDLINGKDGNDFIYGDADDTDSTESTQDDDLLIGGRGSDFIFGGGGDDVLFGQDEYKFSGTGVNDSSELLLENQNDEDKLFGGAGNDNITGGSYRDLIVGDSGTDTLMGGAGDDRILGGSEGDFIFGDSFNKIGFTTGSISALYLGPNFINSDSSLYGENRSYKETLSYDDYIQGGAGDDFIDGEIGGDDIFGGDGADHIVGDRLNVADYFAGLSEAYRPLDALLHGDDRLHGGSGDDRIDGNAGNDIIYGDGGTDLLRGDDNILDGGLHGNDTLYGGGGRDYIEGNGLDDTLYGGDGDDVLWGDRHYDPRSGGILNPFDTNNHLNFQYHGNDVINAGSGDDTIDGGGGSDTILGGSGADTIYADGGNDQLFTPSGALALYHIDPEYHGADTVYGGAGNDTVYGGWGSDLLVGGSGSDRLEGGGNADILIGGTGNDILKGGSNHDTYVFDAFSGADLIDDDAGTVVIMDMPASAMRLYQQNNPSGFSTLVFGSGASLQIANSSFSSFRFIKRDFTGNDTALNVVQNAGTEVDDYILFAADGGTVNSGRGDDSIVGGAGADTINAGPGDDFISGGEGDDVFIIGAGEGADSIDALDARVDKNDTVVFRSDVDPHTSTLVRDGDDLKILLNVQAEDINDGEVTVVDYFLSGAHQINSFVFNDNTVWDSDFIKANYAFHGSNAGEILYGTADADRIWALGGDDQVYAYDGNDLLWGGAGKDFLFGDDGNDVLVGGEGNDVLWGGNGDDTYVYRRGDGVDVIHNNDTLNLGYDVLKMDGVALSDIDILKDGNNVIFSMEGGAAQIQLVNFLRGDIHNSEIDAFDIGGNHLTKGDVFAQIYSFIDDTDNLFYDYDSAGTVAGLAGDDTLWGRAGDDLISGGDGNDTLLGGSGSDTYVISADDTGHDIIQFDPGQDNEQDVIHFGQGINPEDVVITGMGIFIKGGTSRIRFSAEFDEVAFLMTFEDHPQAVSEATAIAATLHPDFANYHKSFSGDTSLLVDHAALRIEAGWPFMLYGSDGSDEIIDPFDRSIMNIALGPGDDLYIGGNNRPYWDAEAKSIDQIINSSTRSIELGTGHDTAFTGGSNDVIGYDGSTYTYDNYDFIQGPQEFIHHDGDDVIHSEGGNDTIANYAGNDRFDPGQGDDSLYSGSGDDTIHFGRGYGSDHLDPDSWFWSFKASDLSAAGDNGDDTLTLGRNISETDVDLWQEGDNLVLGLKHTRDSFTVHRFFSRAEDGNSPLESIDFQSGVRWDINAINTRLLSQAPTYAIVTQLDGNQVHGTAADEIVLASGSYNTLVGNGGNDGLYGNQGVDLLFGGEGDDQIVAGRGDDTLVGGAGNDYLIGGDDNDSYRFGNAFGNDIIDNYDDTVIRDFIGGEAVDRIIFEHVSSPAKLNFSRVDDDLHIVSQEGSVTVRNHFLGQGYGFNPRYAIDEIELATTGEILSREQIDALLTENLVESPVYNTIEGGGSRDVIEGGEQSDLIYGYGGHDTITGLGGNDILVGGSGNDKLFGGAGDDTFLHEGALQGFDALSGDEGRDTLLGSAGDDVIGLANFDVGSAVELIDGGEGINILLGTSSKTVWDFSAAELRKISALDGAAGHDTLTGSSANDVIIGGGGNDKLSGGTGDDTFIVEGSGHGFDFLSGGEGRDILLGSDGDDSIGLSNFTADASVELIDGGLGSNTLVGTSSKTVWDFSASELRNIGALDGGAGHDTLTGASGDDVIIGGAGNDKLFGGAGDDTFRVEGSEHGFDSISGGDGQDTLLGSEGDDSIGLANFTPDARYRID